MAEIEVAPGECGAICHTRLRNFTPYTYAGYAVDANGNYSTPARVGAWLGKGGVLTAQATVLNPGFLVTGGIGACQYGCDIRVDEGNPDWETVGQSPLDGRACRTLRISSRR